MKYYEVSAYGVNLRFDNLNDAEKAFDVLKNDATYIELKVCERNGAYYYAESLKIATK